MKTKICTKCHTKKELADFKKDKRCKDGRGSQCKICQNERKRERWANDPEYREKESRKSLDRYFEHCRNDPKYREATNRRNREYRKKANNPEFCERKNERRRERRANNPEYRERENKRRRERFAKNPEIRERINRQRRERRANDPEYRKHKNEQARENAKKRCDVEKMKPHYVRCIIKAKYKIPTANITNDMIERERELLKINRLFRIQSNESTKKIN